MVDINIQSTLDVDTSKAVVNLNTIRAVQSILDTDSSNAVLNTEYWQTQKAIRSVIEADLSTATLTPTCHKAVWSTVDADTSFATARLNLIKALEDSFNADNSHATLKPTVYHSIEADLQTDSSKATGKINLMRSLNATLNVDDSASQIRYLFLKNPPLPPIGSISVRGTTKRLLKESPTFINNSTYILDTFVVGERLISLHLVFSLRSIQNGSPVVHLQKSTKDTPDSYLQLTSGRGDILVQSITPSLSQRGVTQELFATIMLLPHDFERLPNPAGTYLYDLWVYDLLGTNALIESGQIKVVK